MMERLYTSPTYGMWYPIDPKSLSSNLPPMVVFPESTKFYTKWQEDMEKRGVKVSLHRQHSPEFDAHAQVRLNTELVQITSRSPTVKTLLRQRRQSEDMHNPNDADHDIQPVEEEFDEIVLCVLADTAKRLLKGQARSAENWVLGNTKWSNDITVTHSVRQPRPRRQPESAVANHWTEANEQDADYIRKWYTIDYDGDQAVSTLGGRDDSERVKKGQTEFKPYVRLNE
jgi:hypothetical protein